LAQRLDQTRITNWKEAPVMGIISAAEAATKSSGSSALTFPLLIILVFVGFYFLMIRPQRRRQQMAQQQQKTLEPGAQVRTTAGMYGTVVEVDGDDVVLEVAPGVDMRFLRRAVMEVIASPEQDTGGSFDDDPASFTDEDGTPGTHDATDGVESGNEGLADSHDDDLAKSDKDTVF
jgi:preprotein translocase subunit YajC